MTDTRGEALGRLILGHLVPSFELGRADIAQRRVSPLPIIKQFDILEKVLFRL